MIGLTGRDGKAFAGTEIAKGGGEEILLQKGRTVEDKLRLM